MALSTCHNIIVMGDFNNNFHKYEIIGQGKLDAFCDTFNLTYLVESETRYTNNHTSTINVILTTKPPSFQFTNVTEMGLSDYHGLINYNFHEVTCFEIKIKNYLLS